MDTPSTSVSGAMGRSPKKKKVPKHKKVSDNLLESRDSTCTPRTLIKVNSWISTLNGSNKSNEEEDRDTDSPDFLGFDNSNYSPNHHYDWISNRSAPNEEKLIEDELNHYCNVTSISESSDESPGLPLTRRQRKFSNIIEKDLDDCESVLHSPENENKKELCKYLQLMKPTDKKNVMILQNRRSKRVKNLSIMYEKKELDKKLRRLFSEEENDVVDENTIEEKRLTNDAPPIYNFPKPPENINKIDFDKVAEQNWFKEWSEAATMGSDRSATKRKSNISVEEMMSDDCSDNDKKTVITTRSKSNVKKGRREFVDSHKNGVTTRRNSLRNSDAKRDISPYKRTRSQCRSPVERNRSECRSPAKNRSTAVRMSKRGKRGRNNSSSSDDANKRITRSKVKNNTSKTARKTVNGVHINQDINVSKEKASPKSDYSLPKLSSPLITEIRDFDDTIEESEDLIDIKIQALKPPVEDNESKKKSPKRVLINSIQILNGEKFIEPTKSEKLQANSEKKKPRNSNIGSKGKGPGYKIRLLPAKRRQTRNNNKTNSASKSKKLQNNLTISESDFETQTNAIQEHMKLSGKKNPIENPPEIYLSDSCSETSPIFAEQMERWPREWPRSSSRVSILKNQLISPKIKLSSTTTKNNQESDLLSTTHYFNGVLEMHDTAIQTEPKEKPQFYSQILNIQKSSDEDSEEEPLSKSCLSTKTVFNTNNNSDHLSYPKESSGKEVATWANTKKQQENQNSIKLSTRQGPILKIFYVDFDLVLCQELSVSFWNQSAPGNVLGVHDMWKNKGSIQRQAMNNNCTLKESLEMVACNYFSLAYIELWTKENESYQQEVPVTNVYVVIYFWMKQYNGLVKKVLQLENINGFADDVQYSIVKSSPKIVVSCHYTGNDSNRKKTYVSCYQVASDFQSICNIDKFQAVDHYVSSLHNIEGCDTLIMGCGENKITLWNIEGGRLAATIEMAEIKSPLATLWVKCDRGFLFILQQCVDRELRLIAIHSMNHSWKRLASYAPPEVYDRLKGVCVENGIVLAFYDQGIICWNAGSQEIVVEAAAREETEYISGKYLISIANNEVLVRHAITSLLDLGYWN